jgi:hypothetical protein
LSSGNYVVGSPFWNGGQGAVTWGDGSAPLSGAVSAANSLVGSSPGDEVGFDGITPLSSGNYLVASRFWNGGWGAVTWVDGSAPLSGAVSAANSLVGSSPNDQVGSGGITLLSSGNYLVAKPGWNGGRGAVTWGSGTAGVSGAVSEANSLVGSSPGDEVGAYGITLLSSGNYLVRSGIWNGFQGAVTWGSGTAGVSGAVSEANSLVGSSPGDEVGLSVTVLSSGNYVAESRNGGRGAVTWGSGTAGVSGAVSQANSLVGSNAGDGVGGDITQLSNGNYLVSSPSWNGNRGAVTWGDGSAPLSGILSEANSLVGSSPNDFVGEDGVRGITLLSSGNYLVSSPSWNGNRGAVTWVSGANGQTLDGNGIITPQNSLLGDNPTPSFNLALLDPGEQSFFARFANDGGGRVTVGLTDPNQLSYARAQDQSLTITPDFLTRTLDTGTAVVLQASNDITVNSPITVSAGGSGGALTLQAGRSILINASITTDNGALTLIANDQLANGVVDSQRDPGNAVITLASGATLNTGSGTLTIQMRDGAGLTNQDSGAITLQMVTAGSLAVTNNGPDTGSDVLLGPVTTAGPQSYANPNGTTRVTGNLSAGGNAVTFNNAVALAAGLTLGAGSDTVTFAGGTVAPDPGLVTIAGSLTLSGAATFSVTLNGTDPASYSQVAAGGPIALGGSTLNLVLGYTPAVGDSFTILTTSDPSPINGTFAGLAEGAVFAQGSNLFQITYQGGPNGNSVVLTCVA